MNYSKLFLSALLMGCVMSPLAFAEEEQAAVKQEIQQDAGDKNSIAPAPVEKAPTEMVASDLAVKESEKLAHSIEFLMQDKTDQEKAHFTAIYQGSNIIGVVKTVRFDVKQAVSACSDALPKFSDKMNETYSKWDYAITTAKDKLEMRVNNMIIAQEYAEPQDITTILNYASQLRAKNESALKKEPVTTLDSCKQLHRSMMNTEKHLTKLVDDMILAIPHIQGNAQHKGEDMAGEANESTE